MPVSGRVVSHLTGRELLWGPPRFRDRILLICLALSLAAALLLRCMEPARADDWRVTVGAGALYGPEYPGANTYAFSPVPVVDIVWRDRVFLNSQRGLGVFLFNRNDDDDIQSDAGSQARIGDISVGISVRPSEDRDEDDDDRLEGLGDVDLSAEIGLFASLEVGPIELEAELYHDPGSGHEGTRGELGATYQAELGDRLVVEAGPFLQFGDGQFLESFFGVTGAQAARSALPRHDAGAGLYGAGAGLMARYRISESWGAVGFVEYSRLLGDSADSPIVESEDAFEAGAFVTYSF